MKKSFDGVTLRVKPIGTVRCWQRVEKGKHKGVTAYGEDWVERPRFTDGELLVVAQPVDRGLIRVIHVPTGLAIFGGGFGFRTLTRAKGALEEALALGGDAWRLSKKELVEHGLKEGWGLKLGEIARRWGAVEGW
jgi:hypothetical protein